MKSETIHEVRQVLMNELGLTRAVIREEMLEIVSGETKKIMAYLASNNLIENLVNKEFHKLMNTGIYGRNRIEEICIEAARNLASKLMEENIKISFNKKEKDGTGDDIQEGL